MKLAVTGAATTILGAKPSSERGLGFRERWRWSLSEGMQGSWAGQGGHSLEQVVSHMFILRCLRRRSSERSLELRLELCGSACGCARQGCYQFVDDLLLWSMMSAKV